METDEIIQALRRCADGESCALGFCDGCPADRVRANDACDDGIMRAAAGRLEFQQARIAEVEIQLTESQRRERAAVELIADVEAMINSGAEWFDAGAGEWGDAMERYRGEPGDERRFEMSMHIRDAYRIGLEKFDLAGAKIDRWRGPQEAGEGAKE